MIIYRIEKFKSTESPNATLAPQTRQAKASGENFNYMTLAPQARQARVSGESLNYMTLAQQTRQARPSNEIPTTC